MSTVNGLGDSRRQLLFLRNLRAVFLSPLLGNLRMLAKEEGALLY